MATLTKPTNAPGTSLSYITIGAVLAVISGTSYFFLSMSEHQILNWLRACALILGLVLLAIGFAVGRIGQVSGETQPVAAEPAVPQTAISPNAAANAGSNATGNNPVFTATTRGS